MRPLGTRQLGYRATLCLGEAVTSPCSDSLAVACLFSVRLGARLSYPERLILLSVRLPYTLFTVDPFSPLLILTFVSHFY